MDFIKTGKVLSLCHYYVSGGLNSLLHQNTCASIQVRTYAKRKGYREAAKKKKVKVVIEKKGWIPHNLRIKNVAGGTKTAPRLVERNRVATDDVWIAKFYAWRIFDFKEAIECHRETHHPTIYNVPNAPVNLFIELDMSTAKPTKFVEKFYRMAILPHIFDQEGLQERSVMVFCKTPEQKEAAQNAGASLVGGTELIKEFERGKVVLPDFKFIIAHPSILPEMITIRGLLKKKFPTIKTGTLGPNIAELVTQFKNGVEYSCVKDENTPDYGLINTTIGKLNMDTQKLEDNFKALLEDIMKHKPIRPGQFITRIRMESPPSVEKLKIYLKPYIENEEELEDDSSDEDEAVPAKV